MIIDVLINSTSKYVRWSSLTRKQVCMSISKLTIVFLKNLQLLIKRFDGSVHASSNPLLGWDKRSCFTLLKEGASANAGPTTRNCTVELPTLAVIAGSAQAKCNARASPWKKPMLIRFASPSGKYAFLVLWAARRARISAIVGFDCTASSFFGFFWMGPHSAVVQRRGNPRSGRGKPTIPWPNAKNQINIWAGLCRRTRY